MSVIALDTYEVAKTLRAAGFSEQQAEAVTRVVRDSQNVDLSSLATKLDLAEVKTEISGIKTEISGIKTEISGIKIDIAKVRTEAAETKAEIIKWVFGISIAQAGFIIAMLRFMH
jgi:archaellum component FlaC